MQSVEREPGTGRKRQRQNPRSEWQVRDRPDLRIVSDELWGRAHATRREVRAALAPKGNLARGRDAKHHSPHLFSGFAKCHTCGGAMTSVSGGAGSPRFGCRRSWNEGRNACPNRVTIRIKVAERLILEKLQSELREPANVTQIANAVAKTVRALMDLRPTSDATHQRRLEEERRKLANLIATIEAGGHAPASLLKAVSEREATIERLEAERLEWQVRTEPPDLSDLPSWVDERLENLASLLREDPLKAKAEFRRLKLQLVFRAVEAEPRPYYVITGQCDLSALAVCVRTGAIRACGGGPDEESARACAPAGGAARRAAPRGRGRRPRIAGGFRSAVRAASGLRQRSPLAIPCPARHPCGWGPDEGESGTGKELVARQIHDLSRRRKGPFVAVNCAAIVETLLEAELFGIEDRTATGVHGRRGRFEHAHDGTLFLDEVSDLSPAAQAKLLRAIQDLSVERVGGVGTRQVDTRIIVATNRPLSTLVEGRQFRLDLYYRLNGVDVQVPPLRARREDIPELARYFLERHHTLRPLQVSAAALDALVAYDWPGNVRELERVIERAVALAGSAFLEPDDLPPALLGGYVDVLVPSLRSRETMRAWGSRYARLVLERCENNKRRACRELGISYHTLNAYLRYMPGVDIESPAEEAGEEVRPEGDEP